MVSSQRQALLDLVKPKTTATGTKEENHSKRHTQRVSTGSKQDRNREKSAKQYASPQKFELFPKLPVELQQMIVSYATPPRIIEVELKIDNHRTYATKLRGDVPALLCVNKDIRDEVAKKYMLIRDHTVWTRYIYFNPDVDTLYIYKVDFTKLTERSMMTSNPVDLFNISLHCEHHGDIMVQERIHLVALNVRDVLYKVYTHFWLKQKFISDLILCYPKLKNLDLVYDRDSKHGNTSRNIETRMFIPARGFAMEICHCGNCDDPDEKNLSHRKCDVKSLGRTFRLFEAFREKIILYGNLERVKRFGREYPEWKPPAVRAFSIGKLR